MNSKQKIYGIIGYPVKHSFSPAMHNAAFKALKLDARYEFFEVKPQDLRSFLDSLSDREIHGLNITVPHKEKVLDFIEFDKDELFASQIRAVNTIVKKDGIWKGHNTDVPGFLRHLKENINPANKRVAVLGAGGAGRAVVYAVASSKAKEIVIFDIDKHKVEALVNLMQDLFKGLNIKLTDSVEALDILEKDILINATPIGMKATDSCLVKEKMLHKNLLVYDVIYNPSETKLLALAKKSGAKVCNGLKMLLYQGMISFEIWTGKKAPQEVMWETLSSQISTR